MTITLTWIHHATVLLQGSATVAIDPWKLPADTPKADLIVVSHSHYDHLSMDDVARVAAEGAAIVAPPDCHKTLQGAGDLVALEAGTIVQVKGVTIEGVPAYNIGKAFHPKANAWCGAVITLDGSRVYYAGDTDFVPEMRNLADIDAAWVPVGGTYTMDARAAADAVNAFQPKLAIPYHWGDIVGAVSDAQRFAELAECQVKVLSPGESVEVG